MIRTDPRTLRHDPARHPAGKGAARTLLPLAGMVPGAIMVAGLLLAAAISAGCAAEPPARTREERFPYIQDGNFRVENPSRTRASATGIGCGGSEEEAIQDARSTAHYNLRGVTGNQTYRVEYLLLRKMPREGLHCVEVEARAVP